MKNENPTKTLAENTTLLEALRIMHPELDSHYKKMFETWKLKFQTGLGLCYNHDDLMKTITSELTEIKGILESGLYLGLGLAGDKPVSLLAEEKNQRIDDLKSLLKFENITPDHIKNNVISLENTSSDTKSLSALFDGLSHIVNQENANTIKEKQKPLEESLSDDFFNSAVQQYLRFYYFREYHKFLMACFQDHDKDLSTGPKIQWLGTQRDLAELFIEAVAKGYITKIEIEKIQRYFNKSASIDKLLHSKGEWISHLNRYTYPAVYGNSKSAKFGKIVENPKPEKG
jgi:hypothetical protein